jgi:hypothetical protein
MKARNAVLYGVSVGMGKELWEVIAFPGDGLELKHEPHEYSNVVDVLMVTVAGVVRVFRLDGENPAVQTKSLFWKGTEAIVTFTVPGDGVLTPVAWYPE